eukprot:Skav203859  [mRNA]  locus=scaffold1031:35469:37608:- [translate_table: standard]
MAVARSAALRVVGFGAEDVRSASASWRSSSAGALPASRQEPLFAESLDEFDHAKEVGLQLHALPHHGDTSCTAVAQQLHSSCTAVAQVVVSLSDEYKAAEGEDRDGMRNACATHAQRMRNACATHLC